ncbi:serine/threonine-protein kinase [Striga asiatica]|uniref:Receptor-like serine/threonine-protein kinase n=1 Tax=Striga asiatica TaxID=4170 RepID=A0A5A7R9A1_STRAF|nr:serine/threonine-protein kinase [Striga asiatica]
MITDGKTLISSSQGSFELGFFSPDGSRNRYIGIWYSTKIVTPVTVVWVANRDNPLSNTSGAVLKVISPGILAILNGTGKIIWSSSSDTSSLAAQEPVAQLLDTGNLILREANDENPENYLWQSFDYPTDTFLPGMKLGWNLLTGHENYLSSWRSSDDPGTGDYSFHLDLTGYPHVVLIRKPSVVRYRGGPWNGVWFNGISGPSRNNLATYGLVFDEKEVYFHYELLSNSVMIRVFINQLGSIQTLVWVGREWNATEPNICDSYGHCGPYGRCDIRNSRICECMENFVPRYPDKWAAADWSGGCIRRTPLGCKTDGFVRYLDIKFPDTKHSLLNESIDLEECKAVCLLNCSCMAYTNLDVRPGQSECMLWFGELVDMRVGYGAGQDLYIRMASSEFASDYKRNKGKILIGTLTSLAGLIFLGLSVMLYMCKTHRISTLRKGGWHKENKDLDLPSFAFSTIYKATNNFSKDKKLGAGGFGPVYKGTLEDGHEIAVKRLSKTSMQGLDEFKNEVISIAKLQHRNLVRLLGWCIHGDEKMLIYEYMANKSLDLILFGWYFSHQSNPIIQQYQEKSKLLDWPKRVQIINGIARGLMYLHQDSRLRVIHRDLKTSNILLDMDMNPKISDFGMARTFGGNETGACTSRVVGTYGYMSPEYAIDGLFSVKSDVFSFGVMVLEILSRKRNRGFSHKDHHHNLLGHAWMLYKQRRPLELVNDYQSETCDSSEVLKLIEVGLLCVQKYPEDRPSMSLVVFMLENDVVLPEAKEPGFFTERDAFADDLSISTSGISTNEISLTTFEAR